MSMEQVLGVVNDGRFDRLEGSGTPARLTAIQPQEAIPPEAREIDLRAYEGRAILVEGQDQGGWIYSAAIIDEAGPILTQVVKRAFVQEAAC